MTRRLRAWTGLILLLAALTGLPIALATTIGNPLAAWPDLQAGDMSDRAVTGVIAGVAWLAWASFAVAFTVEFTAALGAKLADRPLRQHRLPLLGTQQDLARTVLAAVFVLAPTVAGAVNPTVHAIAAAPTPTRTPAVVAAPLHTGTASRLSSDPITADAAHGPAVTYTVPAAGGMCTYWDLAAHYLGSGQRWPEIWQLNAGRMQPDGSTMDSPQLLVRGWTVLIPLDRGTDMHDVSVHAGDTLSGLAAEDGIPDWRQVWQANAGRAEPDQQVFADPNLIRPGWTITLPGPATTAEPAPAPAALKRRGALPRPAPHPSRSPESPPPSAPPPAVSTPTSTPATARPGGSTAGPADGIQMPAVFAAGGSVLLAGASLTALRRYRRRQERWRTPGRVIRSTPPALASMEKSLRGSGNAATPDVTWLDQALRGLVHILAKTPAAHLPDVVAARFGADELQLVLTSPHRHPPAPWTADEDGSRWRLRRDAQLVFDVTERAHHFAPFPTLASVGYTETGENWLIDLERVTAMSLIGNADRCLNLARFVAAELSHNAWSEQLQVTLVGFGHELAALNPSRLSCTDDLTSALAAVHGQLAQIGRLVDGSGVEVLTGRLGNLVGDAWAPHVLLINADLVGDRDDLDALLEAMRDRTDRSATAVILVGDTETAATRWQVQLHDDGRLTIPALDLELCAYQLPADEAGPLAQLLALAATTEDEPMPASRGDQPWDAFADAAGAPRANWAEPAPDAPITETPGSSSAPARISPAPAEGQATGTAATACDVQALAPTISTDLRGEIENADPSLDADLAAWHDPDSKRPKLRLLGRPRLTAHGSLPQGRPRTDFYTEVVAFLATRTGTTVAQLATALWPNDPVMATKTAPRQAVTIVRKWLGVNPDTGHDHLPYGGDGSTIGNYQVHGLLIDAELVRRLRLRGVARGASGSGTDDLIAALELVDGIPFDRAGIRARRSPAGTLIEPYSWLVDCPLEHEYSAMITDLAHLAATNLLASGEAEPAAWAAQVALHAGDSSDVPLLDLVAAHIAQGQRATAEEYVRQVMCNHDAEIEEDLPPRTYQLLRRLLWSKDVAS